MLFLYLNYLKKKKNFFCAISRVGNHAVSTSGKAPDENHLIAPRFPLIKLHLYYSLSAPRAENCLAVVFHAQVLKKRKRVLPVYIRATLSRWSKKTCPAGPLLPFSAPTLFGCTYSKFCGQRLACGAFFSLSAMKQKELCSWIWFGVSSECICIHEGLAGVRHVARPLSCCAE